MKTMYVVSKGEYSDYRVMCVTDSKERAEHVADAYNATSPWAGADVEELPYVDSEPQRLHILTMTENLWDDGTTSETLERVELSWEFDLLFPDHAVPVGWRWVRAPIHRGRGGRLDVFGTDHERVRKVFGERKAQIRADEAGALRLQQVAQG